MSNALKHSPSARGVSAENYVGRFLYIFSKNNVSFEENSSVRESV